MVADILDRFQIVAKKDLFPNQLSGGQQQLVGIARAVVHAPSLLLADEPTGNLHSTQAREIMELFRELNRQGTTIVQVTHSEENARYGSRILELRDGWLTRDEACRRTIPRRSAPSEFFSGEIQSERSENSHSYPICCRDSLAAGQYGFRRRACASASCTSRRSRHGTRYAGELANHAALAGGPCAADKRHNGSSSDAGTNHAATAADVVRSAACVLRAAAAFTKSARAVQAQYRASA